MPCRVALHFAPRVGFSCRYAFGTMAAMDASVSLAPFAEDVNL